MRFQIVGSFWQCAQFLFICRDRKLFSRHLCCRCTKFRRPGTGSVAVCCDMFPRRPPSQSTKNKAREDDQEDFSRSGQHVEREHGLRQMAQVAGGQAQLNRGCGAPRSMGGQHGVRGRHSSG